MTHFWKQGIRSGSINNWKTRGMQSESHVDGGWMEQKEDNGREGKENRVALTFYFHSWFQSVS